jgi:dihydrofolate reductase
MARNGVIGRGNAVPWHLPADLKRFRTLTLGKPILMGRRTYESIGRPLPGRDNLVLTRARDWRAAGVTVVHSVDEALQRAASSAELAVIGGAEVYQLTLPLARRIYLTQVLADVDGDTFFPPFTPGEWRDIECGEHAADERHAYAMKFVTLERHGTRGPWASGVGGLHAGPHACDGVASAQDLTKNVGMPGKRAYSFRHNLAAQPRQRSPACRATG